MKIATGNKGFARVLGSCMVGLMALGPVQASVTYTVDSTLDEIDDSPGDGVCHTAAETCTLRAAVMEANRSTELEAFIVLPAGTYALTLPINGSDDELGGDIDFITPVVGNANIRLQGAGAQATIIDAHQIDRVFEVAAFRVVVMKGITVQGGRTALDGGGIRLRANGALTIDRCVIASNASTDGDGGGIAGADFLVITRSEVRGNTATDSGGGIWASGGGTTFYIGESTIAQNEADTGAGLASYAEATISQSTFMDNAARRNGGGIYLYGGVLMSNSTVGGNSAADSGGGMYVALQSNAYARNLYNSTIAFNRADENQDFSGSGGGIYVDVADPAARFNLYNSIIATNYIGATAQQDDCKGVVNTHAQNRFGDTSGCTIVQISGNWDFFYPLDSLGPLQDNGGPTPTVALLPGSNAIDAGNPSLGCLDNTSTTIAEDQRGFPRNVGICDLGAYEYGSIDSNLIFQNGFE